MREKLCILVIFAGSSLICGLESPKKEYGKFTIQVQDYSVTMNENMKTSVAISTEHNLQKNGTFGLSFYVRVFKRLDTLGMKLRQSTWSEQKRRFVPTVNLAMSNVCEKQLAKQVLTLIPGLDENCRVSPGEYNFTIADLDAFTHHLTSDNFFYGTYMALTDIFAGKTRRILRSNATVVFKPTP